MSSITFTITSIVTIVISIVSIFNIIKIYISSIIITFAMTIIITISITVTSTITITITILLIVAITILVLMQRAVSSCGHAEQPNGFRRHIQGRKGKRDTGVFQGLLPTLVAEHSNVLVCRRCGAHGGVISWTPILQWRR